MAGGPQGGRAVWGAAWRWSWDRWARARPGPFGLVALLVVLPAAALVFAGGAGSTADVGQMLGLLGIMAALWVSKGLADEGWREGYVVWWLQKGGSAAAFVSARFVFDIGFVTALSIVWALAASLSMGWEPAFLWVLPERLLMTVLVVALVGFVSAAGSSRDSEFVILLLLLSAARGVLFRELPAWADRSLAVLLPPLAATAEVGAALQRGDVLTAVERSAGPLLYIAVLYAVTLRLAARRVPNA